MKNALRISIFSLIFIASLTSPVCAQTVVRDTVYITSSDIKKMVDDKYYVRVPSSDLEQRLDDKVGSAVNDKFNLIYGLIGVISFLIGSILWFNLRNVVGTRIVQELKDNHLPQLNSRLNDHINEMKQSIKDNFSDLDKEIELKIENYFLKTFKVTLDASLLELKQEQQKALQAQDEMARKSSDMMKEFNERKFEKLKAKVDSRQDLAKTMEDLKDMLNQADKANDVEMISKTMNELSYVLFYLNKDADFEKLLDTYADRPNLDIKETAFVNAALGTLYDYQGTGEITSREKTLKYINKALRKVSGYGEALGLKLELFMTDYAFATEDSKKELAKKEAKNLLEIINSKEFSALETDKRFKRVQASTSRSKYIDLAYQLFPEEIKQMEAIAEAYKSKLELNKSQQLV